MNLDQLGLTERLQKLYDETTELAADVRWKTLCDELSAGSPDPEAYRVIWDEVFADWPEAKGPAPMWIPGANQDSNLQAWINESKSDTYDDFREWASGHREEFWQQAIDKLEIRFATPPSQIVDQAQGVEHAKWLPDSQLNISESCFLADDDAIAIVQGQPDGTKTTITYRQLKADVDQVATSLHAAGYVPGDAIAVFMPMTDLSVVIYLGMVRAGITVISIADSFAPPEIENRLRIAKAKAIFTYDYQLRAGRKLPLHERVRQATEIPSIVIPFQDTVETELREQDQSWSRFLLAPAPFEPHLAGPEHIVNILFSSGTTGDPKAIPWTQSTPIKCATDGFCHHDLKPGDVVCWPTNLGWMMGPWLIFATLMNRGTIALFGDAPMSADFGQFVQDAQVNMLGVVPTIVKAWRNSGCMEPFDWSAVKVFSSTGESSQADDMFYLSSLAQMRPVIEYCGGTEIGGGYITSTVVQPNAPSTFSTPALGLDIEILDEQNDPSESGELFLVPPSIGLSSSLLNRDHVQTYFADTPSTEKNPILRRHGDHMTRLPGGFFIAGGRVDDTMNLGGIKTSSAELERIMNQIEGVKETAAIAVNEAGGPNSLTVFTVLEKEIDQEELQKEMNQRIRAQLNPLFKVQRIQVVDTMPRTASGKVMRRKLREQVEKN